MRVLPVPVGIIAPNGIGLERLKEEIVSWLITEQPAELIFDIENDRTYLAVVDEEFNIDEFVDIGKGVLKFICPMPFKLGPTRTVEFQADERGLVANIQNKGASNLTQLLKLK